MEALRQWRTLTSDQKKAFLAAYLGWMLDAFDFFLLVFVIKDVAAEFHTDHKRVAAAIGLTLACRPIGAFLFAIGMALPFATNAVAFALAAVVVSKVALSARQVAEASTGEKRGWRADTVEGIRWLAAHPPMRILALTIVTFNVTFGAAWAVLVLYAGERLTSG